MTQPQTEFLDLYKAGIKTASDLMKVSLQNAEKLQNQQLVAIRTALDQQSKTMSELGQARTLDELIAVQTKIVGAQVERAVGYWTELCQSQMTQAQSWWQEIGAAQAAASSAGVRAVTRQEHRKSA